MVKPTSLMTRHKIFLFTSPSMAPPLPKPQSNHNGSVFMAHNSHQTTISIFFRTLAGKIKTHNSLNDFVISLLSHPIASSGQTQNGLRSCALMNRRSVKARAAAGLCERHRHEFLLHWDFEACHKKRGGLRQHCSPHLSLNRGNEWTDSAQRFFVLS